MSLLGVPFVLEGNWVHDRSSGWWLVWKVTLGFMAVVSDGSGSQKLEIHGSTVAEVAQVSSAPHIYLK